MAQDLIAIEPDANELLLIFQTVRPLPASIVGDLLSALSRDYREINPGRTLVVSRLQTSSLFVFLKDSFFAAEPYFKDGVEAAKGGKALIDFAKSIREFLTKKKQGGEEIGTKAPGYRSIEAMMKTAAETGSELQVRYTDTDGSSLEANLTPPEAIQIRTRFRQEKLDRQQLRDAEAGVEPTSANRVYEFADQIAQLALPGTAEPSALVSTVVGLLRTTGNDHLVGMLATELRQRGYAGLAEAVLAQR